MTDTRCVIGQYCARHNFIHGAEAEEFREKIERLMNRYHTIRHADLQTLLDSVDARDSLAYLEARRA